MSLSAEETIELTEELKELKLARKKLLTGDMNVSIGSDGDSASFVAPNLVDITARIQKIEAQLGITRGRWAMSPRFL